jgi:hypothetical protein
VVVAFVFAAYSLRVNIAVAASTSDAATRSWHSAETNAQTATRWAPWLEDGWVALADARLGAGDKAGAAAAYRHAITRNGQDWNAWYGLARATSGRVSDAALARALAINPRDPTMRATLRARRQAKRAAAVQKRREQRQAQRQKQKAKQSSSRP